jgi:hypothetical protein
VEGACCGPAPGSRDGLLGKLLRGVTYGGGGPITDGGGRGGPITDSGGRLGGSITPNKESAADLDDQ